MRECGHSLAINAPAAAILDAFFDADALRVWWQVSRSVCTPRPLGSFALEWESTRSRDELLGRLGGALPGTVVASSRGHGSGTGNASVSASITAVSERMPSTSSVQLRHRGGHAPRETSCAALAAASATEAAPGKAGVTWACAVGAS